MWCAVWHCAVAQLGAFRAAVSWLTVLHIVDRAALLARCFALLAPGHGVFYAADFFDKGGLREDEWRSASGYTPAMPAGNCGPSGCAARYVSWHAWDSVPCLWVCPGAPRGR